MDECNQRTCRSSLARASSSGSSRESASGCPISSKTQVLIVSSLFLGLTFSEGYTLGLFLEVGSFVAAVIYFRKEVLLVLRSLVGKGTKEGLLLLKYLVVLTADNRGDGCRDLRLRLLAQPRKRDRSADGHPRFGPHPRRAADNGLKEEVHSPPDTRDDDSEGPGRDRVRPGTRGIPGGEPFGRRRSPRCSF